MNASTTRALTGLLAVGLLAAGGTSAAAAPPADKPGAVVVPGPTFTLDPLPAGVACDFELLVSGTGGVRVTPPLDRDGDPTTGMAIEAGRGSVLTFTNLENGRTLTTSSNGAVTRSTPTGDVTTVVSTGFNVLIFFPTDVPPGPSTTLYTGRVVYTVDADGVFTLVGSSGRTVDICAALS